MHTPGASRLRPLFPVRLMTNTAAMMARSTTTADTIMATSTAVDRPEPPLLLALGLCEGRRFSPDAGLVVAVGVRLGDRDRSTWDSEGVGEVCRVEGNVMECT
jgi:hypothetical protein